MPLFFNNYTKPGPGIPKNLPRKKGFALYFELFIRHFWDFIKENMLFAIVSIPMFFILFYTTLFLDIFGIKEIVGESINSFSSFYAFALFIICGSGPASAGMAYMMRCVTREEHCFLWSDFWEKFKENFKQSIVVSVIDIVLYILCFPAAVKFYYQMYQTSNSNIWYFFFVFTIVIAVIYAMMHMYFYQFIITFELKLKDAMKNSFIMTVLYLPANIMLTIMVLAIIFLMSSYLNPVITAIIMLFFGSAFIRYPIEFFAARAIEKRMLNNPVQETEDKEDE